MRLIDLRRVRVDPDWDIRAADAQAQIAAGVAVAQYSAVWQEVKASLREASFDKCWYCESLQIRSDNTVDHFRPKSLYPWLAVTLSNFRFACTLCNSVRADPDTGETAGKGNHFPLFSDHRARTLQELPNEDRVLLDPCVGSDPLLLDFTTDGRACASYPDHHKRSTRAIKSIHYYHLNHSALIEQRRKLALEIQEWVDTAHGIYLNADEDDLRTEKMMSSYIENIYRKMTPDAEYSVFARRVLDGYRVHPWVEDLLMQA